LSGIRVHKVYNVKYMGRIYGVKIPYKRQISNMHRFQ
jgi:hypothetical protein